VPHGVTLIGPLFEEGVIARAGLALEQHFQVASERPRAFELRGHCCMRAPGIREKCRQQCGACRVPVNGKLRALWRAQDRSASRHTRRQR